PAGTPVYLEDKVTGTFTALHEPGSFYTVNIATQSEGTGRFFLHTKSSVTAIDLVDKKADFTIISRLQNNSIRLIGKVDNNSTIDVYDLAGRKLVSRKLNQSEINDVKMDGLISGVYVVFINSSTQKVSKKISWIRNN
ncbi:MAG: T9SS type A sorting domain-containing protein, partial [Bacteroidetes bacterium]|nr:T9SS type A sorting domain-containing protein [Bacteroidota bacterium]